MNSHNKAPQSTEKLLYSLCSVAPDGIHTVENRCKYYPTTLLILGAHDLVDVVLAVLLS